jgi:4'-phosphopantetheinyl transferase
MAVPSNWSARPPDVRLVKHEIHVWRAFLNREDAGVHHMVLSEDERARASRFVFPRDRDHFVASRGILRAILGHYLQRPAGAIEFAYEREGKPRLRLRDADAPIRFNLSHSHGLAVYAFSNDREIGIDVEAIRADVTGEEIAERFFSSRESAELRALPRDRRDEGFFLCWTRKEAYVKARGAGLGIALDSFDVSLTPGLPAELKSIDHGRWMLRSFQPAVGYAGAVVAEGKDWALHLWDWMGNTQNR